MIKKPINTVEEGVESVNNIEEFVNETTKTVETVNTADVNKAATSFTSRYQAVVTTPNGGSVKLRNQPSMNGTVWYATPANGEVLTIIDIRGEWCKAQYKSVSGWVQSKYLQALDV